MGMVAHPENSSILRSFRLSMKNISIRSAIAGLILVVINLAFAPDARAERQSRADAIAILTSGTWHFVGNHFKIDKVFDAKGTMTTVGGKGKDSTAKWKVDYKQVTITYSYYEEILLLPLDPQGTKGVDAWGDDFTATLKDGSATPIATPTPPPAGLDALQPVTPEGPELAAIITQLTAKKWHFKGGKWSDDRMFDPNGTLTVEHGKPAPGVIRWQITGNQVVMIFPDHQETLTLPLDPKGTTGADATGQAITASQPTETASQPATTSESSGGGDSYFGKSGHDNAVPTATPFPSPANP
jgi:hypothetical protein